MEPKIHKVDPLPPARLNPSNPARQRLRKTKPTMKGLLTKLLLKIKEGTTWMGFAVLAQFLPINVEELQIIWTAITGIAGVVLLFLDEDKTKKAKASEQG